MPKTTYSDVAAGRCEDRGHQRTANHRRENGKTYTYITCPFCEVTAQAFLWSLAGGGKRCTNPECGALHTNHGKTYRRAG